MDLFSFPAPKIRLISYLENIKFTKQAGILLFVYFSYFCKIQFKK